MQDSVIGDGVTLSYTVIDKDVKVSRGSSLQGSPYYPMYIAKKSIV